MAFEKGGTCWSCGAALGAEDYRRGDVCAACRRETRCCRNCEFHAPARGNECRETAAEPPADKEKSNFCDFFHPAARSGADAGPGSGRASAPKDAAKAALEALFKKKRP